MSEGGDAGGRQKASPTVPKVWRSRFAYVVLAAAVVLLVTGAYPRGGTGGRADALLCAASRDWRARFGDAADLHVVVSDVLFRGAPGDFVPGEGVVAAPIAASYPGVQEVLDVRADPPPARVLRVEGQTVVTWPYAAALHRDLRFTAIALVRRAPASGVAPPEAPSFDTLPHEVRVDATLKAREIEEAHALDRCKAFHDWAVEIAGAPPHTEQLRRIVRALRERRISETKKSRWHDACAALREGRYTRHQAHVLAVLAMREIDVPAHGFVTADGRLLVGVFVDGVGWMTIDVDEAGPSCEVGGPALLTRAPLGASFDTSTDGFWLPSAGAFEPTTMGAMSKSWTEWRPIRKGEPADSAITTDTTSTWSIPLAEACR